jgi:hypothetical protein
MGFDQDLGKRFAVFCRYAYAGEDVRRLTGPWGLSLSLGRRIFFFERLLL